MKPDEAAAMVRKELEADDAEREGMYNPEPQMIFLLTDAVRALLAGYEAAKKTIFDYSGCVECRWFDGGEDGPWCLKHDRETSVFDGCNAPEWRGLAPSRQTIGGEMVRKMLDEIGPEQGGEGGAR